MNSMTRKCLWSVATALALFSGASHTTAQTGGTFDINTQFVTGLSSPTAMAFAPDGRLFITQQAGSIRIVTASGQLLPTPFLTLPSVRSDGERGLLGLAFHPQFTTNGHLYIFYSPGNAAVSRLSRVTASGDRVVEGSEVTIFEYGNFSGNHRGGDIHFGPDGKLYVALGDAGEPTNSQSAASFDGKILRFNADGTVPSDNPASFVNTSGTTITPAGQFRAIWAIGLRNPYRFSFHATNGTMRINDVGAGLWEEVNIGQGGANYGWPTCEGTCANVNARNPIYVHERGNEGCAITGGAFQAGTQFPSSYADNYFLIDYCSTWLRHLRTDNSEVTFPLSVPQFSVDLKFAPDGSLYVLGHGSGVISRITYSSGTNRSPVAAATASPTSGQAPLVVQFSGSGSTDPDGDSLTYAWEFGDGGTGTGITASHTYAGSGSHTARLTVSDGRGGTSTAQVTIAVGSAPSATIVTPAASTLYTAGQTISFSGTATDPEDGALPGSAFRWVVVFHHDTHTHPALGPLTGATSGSFTIPTTGHTEENVFYRVNLTVTDSTGLQTTVSRDVLPRKSRVTLASNVPGAQILLDGQPQSSPVSFIGVVGVVRTIDVTSPQTVNGQRYSFTSWSDGGARSHTIMTPAADATYTAHLTVDTSPVVPDPTLHWKFDNNVIESIRGTSTSARGALAYRTDDKAPVASNAASLSFDGADGTYVAVAGEQVLSGWAAATTGMWIRVTAAAASSWAIGSDHTLMSKAGVIHTRIRRVGANDLRFVAAQGDGTALGTQIISTLPIPTDAWVHLASVHQGSTLTLYVGGQPAGTGAAGRTFGGLNTQTFDIVGHGGRFLGLMDDVRLFNVALTAADVAVLGGAPRRPAAPTGLRIIR